MKEDITVNHDNDNKQINLDNTIGESTIHLKENNDELLSGLELLTNKKKEKDKGDSEGYSSGEDNHQKKDEDYNFFENEKVNNDINNNEIPEMYDGEKESKHIPINDPMMDSIKANDNGGFKALHSMNSQEIKNEKIDLIYRFKRLDDQGVRTTMNYNMNSNLEDMRNEYLKLKKQREIDNSVKFQRKIMMAAITGLEYLNGKFDPFNIKLDGWSESVNEDIYDYDEVFEELAEKYGGKTEMAPEIKLLMMLGGSAFMFHLTQTVFKSSIPGMDDIMKQNPELMQQFAQAAVSSIGRNPMDQQSTSQRSPQRSPQRPPQRPSQSQSQYGEKQMPTNNKQSNDTKPIRPKEPTFNMEGPEGLDEIINQMNISPDNIPDLDSISLVSADTDKNSNRSGSGITLNM